MPGPYWGNHFLSHIRKQGKVTPVVVVSGYLRREIVEEIVTRQRVTAVLAKPFTVKRVASELHKALEGTAALGG
jgi:DNA-binding NtrC family response regulator